MTEAACWPVRKDAADGRKVSAQLVGEKSKNAGRMVIHVQVVYNSTSGGRVRRLWCLYGQLRSYDAQGRLKHAGRGKQFDNI